MKQMAYAEFHEPKWAYRQRRQKEALRSKQQKQLNEMIRLVEWRQQQARLARLLCDRAHFTHYFRQLSK